MQKSAFLGGHCCKADICNRAYCLGQWGVRFQPPSCLQPNKKIGSRALQEASLFPRPIHFALVKFKSLLLSRYHLLVVVSHDYGLMSAQKRQTPITRLLAVLACLPPFSAHHIQGPGSQIFSSLIGLAQEAGLMLVYMRSPEIVALLSCL